MSLLNNGTYQDFPMSPFICFRQKAKDAFEKYKCVKVIVRLQFIASFDYEVPDLNSTTTILEEFLSILQ